MPLRQPPRSSGVRFWRASCRGPSHLASPRLAYTPTRGVWPRSPTPGPQTLRHLIYRQRPVRLPEGRVLYRTSPPKAQLRGGSSRWLWKKGRTRGGMDRERASHRPGGQVRVAGALLGKGIVKAEAQFQPNGAPDPGQEVGSWQLLAHVQPGSREGRGPAQPHLAERMITRASSSRASISRAVTFLVPGSNCSTFSACGVSRSISRWPGQGT